MTSSGGPFGIGSECGAELIGFILITVIAMGFAAMLPYIIAIGVTVIKLSVAKDNRRSAYAILEEILAKTNLEERNEAFLDACVEYSKKRNGKKEPGFDREDGFGKLDEVYSHFIKMESKRLEEKRKAEGESGAKAPEEKIASKEKVSDMV